MIEVSDKIGLYDYVLDDVKRLSIVSFLQNLGIKTEKKQHKVVASSPLSVDNNPSLVVYPENTFYDFSTGVGGSIIDLVMNMWQCTFIEAVKFLRESATSKDLVPYTPAKIKIYKKNYSFNLETYYARFSHVDIKTYMNKRSLNFNECNCGNYFSKSKGKWYSNPSVMFFHRDEYGNICGAKFRNINDKSKQRWNSRGRLFFHVLENMNSSDQEPIIFITESETSSNSLFRYLKFLNWGHKNFVILCFGGVHNAPKILPIKYEAYNSKRYIIIDYDNNEEQYNKRVEGLSHFKAKDIKLVLDKGDDINSLYCRGEIYNYDNLFGKL
jgi:hypothetical protein